MGMDRVAERLREGSKPLRVPELARLLGCSEWYVRKVIDAGTIAVGSVGRVYSIPIQEARKLANQVGVLRD